MELRHLFKVERPGRVNIQVRDKAVGFDSGKSRVSQRPFALFSIRKYVTELTTQSTEGHNTIRIRYVFDYFCQINT